MIRQSENYIDNLDIEKEFNPRDNINKNMDKPCETGRMGGKGGPVEEIKARNEKK